MKRNTLIISLSVLIYIVTILDFTLAENVGDTVMYQSDSPPSLRAEWIDRGPCEGIVEFRLALQQDKVGLQVLEKLYSDISNPRHPEYQNYKTYEYVQNLLSPPFHVQSLIVEWLQSFGNVHIENHGDWMKVTASCADTALILGLSDPSLLRQMVHPTRPDMIEIKIASGSYRFPSQVAQYIAFVQNLASFRVIRRVSAPSSPSSLEVVPSTVNALYSINYTISSSLVTQAVVEFTDKSWSLSDMTAFCTGVGIQQPNTITNIGPYNGGKPADDECTLDIQWITAIGKNGTNIFWTSTGWLLDWAQDVLAAKTQPLVNSISWSTDERNQGQSYNFQCDTAFQKMGVLGLTILAASGDSGAVGTGKCSNPYTFNPGYPTTSPYVVSVGATMLVNPSTPILNPPPVCRSQYSCAQSGPEDPADEPAGGYATGGGFSVFEKQPSWQASAVSAYLSNSQIPKPPSNDFNSNNRGFPDVAANGNNIVIHFNGAWQITGGTSAATPIFGAICSIMNDFLLRHGKQPVGPVMPLLYQMSAEAPQTFKSIGSLSTSNKDQCNVGYVSNPNGWDPVTGNGTPNVAAILEYLSSNLAMFRNRDQ